MLAKSSEAVCELPLPAAAACLARSQRLVRQPPPAPGAEEECIEADPVTARRRGDHQAGHQLDQVLAHDQVMAFGLRVGRQAGPGGHGEVNHGQEGRGRERGQRSQEAGHQANTRSRSDRTSSATLSMSRLVHGDRPESWSTEAGASEISTPTFSSQSRYTSHGSRPPP